MSAAVKSVHMVVDRHEKMTVQVVKHASLGIPTPPLPDGCPDGVCLQINGISFLVPVDMAEQLGAGLLAVHREATQRTKQPGVSS